jgi:ferredoxin
VSLSKPSSGRGWALLISALLFFAGARCAERFAGFDNPYAVWAGAALLVVLALPAFSVVMELSLFPCLYLGLAHYAPIEGTWVSFPLVVATLCLLAHPLSSRLAALLLVAGSIAWLDVPALLAAPSALAWTFVGAGALALALFLVATGTTGTKPTHVDVLLNSYSGNTAHFAETFCDALKNSGVRVTVHRLHHHRDFRPDFTGDALVVAYPVAGWNPFWPMLEYFLFRLPPGGGKPAFLLYTSGGGPENCYVVPWLALRARGYRVLGRLGATYPINVTLFRLVSSRAWRFLDTLLPRRSDLRLAESAAMAFAAGRRAGLGLALFPFVLFILGPLTYNRFVNYIYRGYSFKRLCTDCGRCIRFCPTERLYMKNGRVRAKGTCALCYGCVNLCPTDAMQLALVSEIGNVYRPRWPKLLVKRKPGAGPPDQKSTERS